MKRCCLPVLLAMACAAGAAAQSFPAKPVRLVITYPPGGSTDVVGRALAAKLTDALGQQVVVDNRGGAGGTFAPAGTPRAVVAKLNQVAFAALRSADLSQSLVRQGSEPNLTTPDALARFVKTEHDRWARVVKAAGMKAE